MINKEILELAAKAAGYAVVRVSDDGESLLLFGVQEPWNPLEDNADAFELAVKLSLTVHQWGDEVCVCNVSGTINEGVAYTDDRYADTRRAIVRAAAELGKSLK